MDWQEAVAVAQQFLDAAGVAQVALPHGVMENADAFVIPRSPAEPDDRALVVAKATGEARFLVNPPWAPVLDGLEPVEDLADEWDGHSPLTVVSTPA